MDCIEKRDEFTEVVLRDANDKLSKEEVERWHTKLINLWDVCCELFPTDANTEYTTVEMMIARFSPDFAKELHCKVMKDLLNNKGEYRQNHAKPAHSLVRYTCPTQVQQRMERLFSFVREHMPRENQPNNSERLKSLKLAALFFSEFLLIHPFSNGNGRTARLLLSHLLRFTFIVPISLLFKGRETYLKVLEDRHTDPKLASLAPVAMYVAECVQTQASQRVYCEFE